MSSVILFDVRNFSAHRDFLGKQRKAQPLAELVKKILNLAVEVIKKTESILKLDLKPVLNHTGDGFVAIFKGPDKSLMALLFVSRFVPKAEKEITEYNNNISKLFPGNSLPKLDYGIGMHGGSVNIIKFKDFSDSKKKETKEGYLGHAINVASRVEQSTKEHTYRVICTRSFYNKAFDFVKQKYRKELEQFFDNPGTHRFPGIIRRYTLFGIKKGFYLKFKVSMLNTKGARS